MKNILTAFFLLLSTAVFSQSQVEIWNRFELKLKGSSTPNSFTDVSLQATFTHNDTTITVNGFYDGDNRFIIRFMPVKTGKWTYSTISNQAGLNRKTGGFTCVPATGSNRGPVKVSNTYNFAYADGTSYYPFGTTAYAWIHMPGDVQAKTLKSLADARFNKVRMCVFPKNYALVKEEPTVYPYPILNEQTHADGEKGFVWDYSRFDVRFFHHLEKQIDALRDIGVEADLILFHPYDKGRWGFDSMTNEANIRYIEYITARLASFRNVWWSLANEYDYVSAKTEDDWDLLTKAVVKNDPYRHLCSIHGSTAKYYKYWNPEYTHASIQDEAPVSDFGRAATVRNIYYKPVIFDEACYEGNLPYRWGRLSGEEMLHTIWQGLLAGTYVTHGECYTFNNEDEALFWAKGGEFRGTSWKRIGFTRDIIEAAPHMLQLADVSRDDHVATAGDGYYMVYFGKQMQSTWLFDLPAKNADYPRLGSAGKKFKVEIIDTWDMTITEYPVIFETTTARDYRVQDKDMRKVRLPLKPYLALRITEVNQPVPRDNSFNTHQTYIKVKKDRPYVEIAQPQLPPNVVAYEDVVYSVIPGSPYGKRELLMNIYRRDDQKKYPALLLVHGGAWTSGSRSMQIPLAQQIAAHGYVTIPVEYRLLPEATYPAALHDLKTAVRWIKANGDKYGIDTTRVAISGCSAGGHLASLVGMTNGSSRHEGKGEYQAYSSDVQAVIDIDGVVNFVNKENIDETNENIRKSGGELPINARWLQGRYEDKKDIWEEASPLLWVTEKSAPICFINCLNPRYQNGRDLLIEKLNTYHIYSEKQQIKENLHPFWLFHPWFNTVVEYMVGFMDKAMPVR